MLETKEKAGLLPPIATVTTTKWIRQNLLSSPVDAALTILCILFLSVTIPPLLKWVILDANIGGTTRQACTGGGACWVFVKVWLPQFIYGLYPADQRWRVDLTFGILVLALAYMLSPRTTHKARIGTGLLSGYPVIAFILLIGGVFGLALVETSEWGGLFLTILMSAVSIVFSLPIGVLLAIGRQSELPVIRILCVLYIEILRGLPLVMVLFIASVLFPILLPTGVTIDKLLRALVAVLLFTAAEVAEVIRGGLQAIPKGQYEAAMVLGLGYWRRTFLIIVPQALKIAIPGLVNTLLGLFMSSTVLITIGLFDLLGAVQLAVTNPNWLGFSAEGTVFVAATFWVFCFGMSRYSLYLERKFHIGHKS